MTEARKFMVAAFVISLASAMIVRGSKSPAIVGNFVWDDVNRNGIQDQNEPGINGVTVKAYNATNHQLIATTVTQNGPGQDGHYALPLDPPTVFYLAFDLPLEYQFTLAKQGTDDTVDSDVDALTGQTRPISLDRSNAGRVHADWDAGLVRKLFERPAPIRANNYSR